MNCEFQSKLWNSVKNCAFQSKLWISVKIVNFSQNCEFQSKLWISVTIVNFSWNFEFQYKLWNLVEIIYFSWNCEFQSKLWRSVKIQSIPFGVGLMRNRKIGSRKYSFIKRTNAPSENGLQPKWGLPGWRSEDCLGDTNAALQEHWVKLESRHWCQVDLRCGGTSSLNIY